ncbi:MAG: ATP-binding protein, partial [Lentisphaeraceae bacterium]|nr:ATP-binding protein [Lentisphaeraceae bacterium]
MKKALILLILLATEGLFGLFGQQAERAPELIKVELPGEVDYRYAGIISAMDQGFFQEKGLNVEVTFGSDKKSIQKRVLAGETDFSVCGSEIIIDHYNGLPLIVITAIFQRSPYVLVTKQEPNKSDLLKDKAGYKLSFSSKPPIELLSIISSVGMTQNDFNFETDDESRLQRFIKGEFDGIEANYLYDIYSIQKAEKNVKIYAPENFGTEMYDHCFYTNKDFYHQNLSTVVKFRQALFKGWSYALANKGEVVNSMWENYDCKLEEKFIYHQEWMVVNRLILPDLIKLGSLRSSRWEKIRKMYVAQGLLPEDFKPGHFYHSDVKLKSGFYSGYYKEIILALGLIILVVIILLIMNRKLVHMVDRRTLELAEVNWQLSKFNEELEAKIQKRTVELEKALKNTEVASKAKSTFLANMTHEIRTPMNSILGFAQIMKEKTLDKDMVKYLDTINSSGQNLLRIINDVLDLSRVESGKFSLDYSRFNLLRLIEETMSMFSEEIHAKKINLKFHHADECPEYIYLDKDRLRQVLTNVIGNAVKFTEEGLIEVKLTLSMVGPKEADVIVEVKDTGIGIPEENLESIFGEFEQVDNVHLNYGGTGLGLAISKRLVEMMGGELSVKSEEGRGSDFEINLSRVSIVDKADDRVESKKQQYYFEPAKVMIVDECQLTRDLFEAYLSVTRLTVRTYPTAFDALNELVSFKPDLIITEITMCSMDGFQLVEEVREYEGFKKTPVIAISSITHTGSRQKFRVFNGFLKKPISVNDFYQSISHFLPCKVIVKNQEIKEVSV